MPQLALWGQICCRLAARPECVEAAQMSGFLDLQVKTQKFNLTFREDYSSYMQQHKPISHSFSQLFI